MDVSVIIPFCNEWSQIVFTIRAVAEQLKAGYLDFEIIVIDNMVEDIRLRPDRGHDHYNDKGQFVKSHIASMAEKHKWLRYIRYDDKLSHWNAKRVGVKAALGEVLWFLDAHVMPDDGIWNGVKYYFDHQAELDGTMHFPLTYHILESQRLIYKPDIDIATGQFHYKFKNYTWKSSDEIFEVPVMSTCGMMISKDLYELTGGWPEELGIYGGGENFMNFTLAILGKKKYIYPVHTLFHHGDKRGYKYDGPDWDRNRTIANYLFAGEDIAVRWVWSHAKHTQASRHKTNMLNEVMHLCRKQRDLIQSRQEVCIEDWAKKWEEKK